MLVSVPDAGDLAAASRTVEIAALRRISAPPRRATPAGARRPPVLEVRDDGGARGRTLGPTVREHRLSHDLWRMGFGGARPHRQGGGARRRHRHSRRRHAPESPPGPLPPPDDAVHALPPAGSVQHPGSGGTGIRRDQRCGRRAVPGHQPRMDNVPEDSGAPAWARRARDLPAPAGGGRIRPAHRLCEHRESPPGARHQAPP